MWYEFDQSNPGGSFDSSMPRLILVEANNSDEANDRAESVGVYFDGADYGRDCSCCGDRWSRSWQGEGKETPTLTWWKNDEKNTPVEVSLDDDEGMKAYFAQGFIIFLDSTYKIQIVPLKGKPKTYEFKANKMREEKKAERRAIAPKLWGCSLYHNGIVKKTPTRFYLHSEYDSLPNEWWAKDGNQTLHGKGEGLNKYKPRFAQGKEFELEQYTFGSKDKKEVQEVIDFVNDMKTEMLEFLKAYPVSNTLQKQVRNAFYKAVKAGR